MIAVVLRSLRSAGSSRFILAAGLIFLGGFLFAQAQLFFGPIPLPPQSGAAGIPSHGSVVVITARNEDGTPAELSASDLEIRVDGKETEGREVRRLASSAFNYCLLFDTSGSQKARFQQQQQQATQFLTKVPQPGRDYGTLVAFNDQVFLDAEGTDPGKLTTALSKERPVGGTALYNAIASCANRLAKNAPDSDQRLMFIFSDGEDNASTLTRDAAAAVVMRAGVRVYAIGDVKGPRAVAALKKFAQESGGKDYFVGKEKDFDAALTDLSRELANRFAVTFASLNSLPADHIYKLEIRCSKKGIFLSTPRQYYAPPR